MTVKLNEHDVREILEEYADGWGCNIIARNHYVTPKCVHLIVSGQRWPHLPRPWKDGERPNNLKGANPRNQQRVKYIAARRAEGMTYRDIAMRMGITESYARQLVQRYAPGVR